ncbi:MAG: hypothetical protein JRJ29_11650 [Deltaproteobacteria bacterium]|nr:hypothetical protein [Deltaproteobacteria bacterium]
MWVFTRDGFYSVVHDRYCQPDELMVRSRDKRDLMRLSKKVPLGTVLETKKADYRYRAVIKRSSWAAYLSHEALEIGYDNFKNAVYGAGEDEVREIAYMNVWVAMREAYQQIGRYR